MHSLFPLKQSVELSGWYAGAQKVVLHLDYVLQTHIRMQRMPLVLMCYAVYTLPACRLPHKATPSPNLNSSPSPSITFAYCSESITSIDDSATSLDVQNLLFRALHMVPSFSC